MIATQGLRGTVPDNAGGGIFVGSSPPSSSLTHKVWFKIDAAGRPFGAYMFYNGNWRKCYTGSLGDIKLYIGAFNGVFDGSGRGIIGGSGPYDEDGWQLCNGQNGAPNLDGYFPAGAAWNGSAWVTSADGLSYKTSGGVRQIQIALGNLPAINTPMAYSPFWAKDTGNSYLNASQTVGQGVKQFKATGTGANTPINTTPVFIAMAYLMFIGYQ
jgi:hypothetical protein